MCCCGDGARQQFKPSKKASEFSDPEFEKFDDMPNFDFSLSDFPEFPDVSEMSAPKVKGDIPKTTEIPKKAETPKKPRVTFEENAEILDDSEKSPLRSAHPCAVLTPAQWSPLRSC